MAAGTFRWSPELLALRAEIAPLVERFLKLRDQELVDSGQLEDDPDEFVSVQDQFLVSWLVVGEFQPLDGSSEESAVLTGTSGITNPAAVGLLHIGMESFM